MFIKHHRTPNQKNKGTRKSAKRDGIKSIMGHQLSSFVSRKKDVGSVATNLTKYVCSYPVTVESGKQIKNP